MTTKGGSLNGAAAPSRDDNIHLAERTHAAQLCCLSLPHAPRRTSRTLYARRHFGRKSPSFGAGWMQELVMNYVFAHSPCHPMDENLRQHPTNQPTIILSALRARARQTMSWFLAKTIHHPPIVAVCIICSANAVSCSSNHPSTQHRFLGSTHTDTHTIKPYLPRRCSKPSRRVFELQIMIIVTPQIWSSEQALPTTTAVCGPPLPQVWQ